MFGRRVMLRYDDACLRLTREVEVYRTFLGGSQHTIIAMINVVRRVYIHFHFIYTISFI